MKDNIIIALLFLCMAWGVCLLIIGGITENLLVAMIGIVLFFVARAAVTHKIRK